jgi:hypothetical protein
MGRFTRCSRDESEQGGREAAGRLPSRPARLQVASTQRAVYKSQRPVASRGVGMALLHLTGKEERKNGLGELIDIYIHRHSWVWL